MTADSPPGAIRAAVFIAALRDGAWLTRQRMTLWAGALLAASVVAAIVVVAGSNGWIDYQGRPLGTDFSNVYAAGTYVRDGTPTLMFDGAAQHAREQAIFGDQTPFYGWHYPPFFLFVAAALAAMPYPVALAVWQGVTFALYLWMMSAVVRAAMTEAAPQPSRDKLWLLLAAAYPAVFVNFGHGHNGFLTAALFGGALTLLDRRPLAAGVMFGLLAYKPQFGLMIPIALAASGRWRVVAAAGATVAALVALATLAFGTEVWSAFAASMHFTRVVVLEAGDTGWEKIQSVFSWTRMWGGSVGLAYAAQAMVTLAMGIIVALVWRLASPAPLKGATLLLAAILSTPYSLDYDLMVLAPAIAMLAAHGLSRGFARWEKTALAALWIAPLVARSIAHTTLVPLGVVAMLAMVMLLLRRTLFANTDFAGWNFSQMTQR